VAEFCMTALLHTLRSWAWQFF